MSGARGLSEKAGDINESEEQNWSPFWKSSVIASTLLVTFAQTLGPLAIAPIFPQLMEAFHSDLAGVVQFTGITILVLGFSNFIW